MKVRGAVDGGSTGNGRPGRQARLARLEQGVPAIKWARNYDRGVLGTDLVAAVIASR